MSVGALPNNIKFVCVFFVFLSNFDVITIIAQITTVLQSVEDYYLLHEEEKKKK